MTERAGSYEFLGMICFGRIRGPMFSSEIMWVGLSPKVRSIFRTGPSISKNRFSRSEIINRLNWSIPYFTKITKGRTGTGIGGSRIVSLNFRLHRYFEKWPTESKWFTGPANQTVVQQIQIWLIQPNLTPIVYFIFSVKFYFSMGSIFWDFLKFLSFPTRENEINSTFQQKYFFIIFSYPYTYATALVILDFET